jgi:hypothetical protein
MAARRNPCGKQLRPLVPILVEAIGAARPSATRFGGIGFGTDNDSLFMNEAVKTYCDESGVAAGRPECSPDVGVQVHAVRPAP